MSEVLGFLHRLVTNTLAPWLLGGKGLAEWLVLGDGPNNSWFAPAVCLWLATSYETCRRIGKRFEWEPVQVLQVYRSIQVRKEEALQHVTFSTASPNKDARVMEL
jgi:hypothetical protein